MRLLRDRLKIEYCGFDSVAGTLRVPSADSRGSRRTATSLTAHGVCLRRGFTLVELLVVIAVIGILVALLLPAIQAAREAARRAQCSSNLRNLALAALNFHDARGHFPVDEDYTGDPPDLLDLNTGQWLSQPDDPLGKAGKLGGGGWIAEIMPQVEEQALYDRFKPYMDRQWYRLKLGLNDDVPDLRAALQVQPAVLVCPSDAEFQGPRDDQYPFSSGHSNLGVENPPALVATTHYKGNAGDTALRPSSEQAPFNEPPGYWSGNPTYPVVDCHYGYDCFGIFWRYTYARGGVTIREITDGTSKTFLIGEASPVDGNSAAWSSDGDWAITGVEINFDWRSYATCVDPDTGNPRCWWSMRGFRSMHPGGVHFALADGSVRLISDSIDHPVYRALSTRERGELIGDY